MRALARIVVQADGTGGSRLAVCSGEAPLLPRRTGPAAGPVLEVHLVGGAAGPLRGDSLRIEVEVGAGASLVLRTVAASVVLGGPGPARSQSIVDARVAGGGRLVYLPEPVVATAGCDHRAESIVELDATASLVWREELVCGRHGEEPGDLLASTTVRRGGATLLRQEIAVGPRAPGWSGPAALGGARTAGSLLLVEPAWVGSGPPAARTADRGALMPLSGPAVLISAVADQAHELRRTLDTLASLR